MILSIVSLPYLFVFDSISFIFALLFLSFVIIPKKEKRKLRNLVSIKEIFSGIKYAKDNKPLGLLFILTIINNFFIMGPAYVGMLILIKDSLGGTASDYAFVEAGLAFGMLIGSILVYRIEHKISIGKLLLVGMFLDGITYSVMYFANSVNLILIFIVIHGIGIPMITIARTAIIQKHSPNKFHGRLFSLVHLSVIGVTALSSAVVGIAANYIDIKLIFLFIGIGAALCGIVGFMNKELRDILNNMKSYYLVLDQGTSSSKIFLFDEEGNIVFSDRERHLLNRPKEHHVESNPIDILNVCTKLISSAISYAKSNNRKIESMGMAVQRSTFLFWDKQSLKHYTHAISWQDSRAQKESDQFNKHSKRIEDITGVPLSAHFGATKIFTFYKSG